MAAAPGEPPERAGLETDAVRHTPVGARNNRLNRAAFCLGVLGQSGRQL
ncbi:MAG TPA: hypothetical protein VJ622_17335 [Acidimicrobiia bacterium]|nr:hypothetical protein [Acidimicrobiia bacterium]